MGINAYIPRTTRFVISVRANARHIVASSNITGSSGITFASQTFAEDTIHVAGQVDAFRHTPGRTQTDDAVQTHFLG